MALGAHVGPKIPVATGSHGWGVESLLLLGAQYRRWHAAVNVGGFIDPAPDATTGRPRGMTFGLDLACDLDSAGRFSLTAELSAVRFTSPGTPPSLWRPPV